MVSKTLALVGLSGIKRLKPSELSGGMRKRVAIARAVAMSPKYLFYDEPTTGLDPVMTQRINRLIRDLQERLGVTSVVVTHDLESAFAVADRLAFLTAGQIGIVGTRDEIRASADINLHEFLSPG